jgi:hypothetical protein
MFELLKIIHMFCLLGGGAAMLGNAVLMRLVMRSGQPPAPMVGRAMEILGKLGLGAIIFFWLTGVPMAVMLGSFADGGWAFWAKLVAAAAVLGLVPYMTWLNQRAKSGGPKPDPALMRRLAMLTRVLVGLAIILAVIAFD